ncbi:ECF-type sigma factor [Engelhardtia mirabilis]|uniref:RNA polymerase sigma factor n=1 Tax=Engelhardtia mirabilis TaxID=2528011 RepID=A0A518BGU3_9BACT|nr:RNA polymerase sigma factor [Planctomycetes bacterium Pla133]QDV00501.1 RNA polymerase sigma factor [Planctomycetes bacterium Pla86]
MSDPRSPQPRRDLTRLVGALDNGEREAAQELLPLVYGELRRLAASRLAKLSPGQTLQATALVHEAYLELVGTADPGWQGRAHFFGAAARAMRDLLADHLQRKGSLKRGGHLRRLDADVDLEPGHRGPSLDDLAVEDALQELEAGYPRQAEVVTLSFFGGLSSAEVAEVLGRSTRTVERDWRFAKAWLNAHLSDPDGRPGVDLDQVPRRD